ncbi:unnamed protein product [Discosporangium mesarthrocarpum]
MRSPKGWRRVFRHIFRHLLPAILGFFFLRLLVSLLLPKPVAGFVTPHSPAKLMRRKMTPFAINMKASEDYIPSPMTITTEHESVLTRIQLRPPYLALHNLYLDRREAGAHVLPEQQLGSEVGPISAAEAARHLSALVSAAASEHDPDPGNHYYMLRHLHLRKIIDDRVEEWNRSFPEGASRLKSDIPGKGPEEEKRARLLGVAQARGERLLALVVCAIVSSDSSLRSFDYLSKGLIEKFSTKAKWPYLPLHSFFEVLQ